MARRLRSSAGPVTSQQDEELARNIIRYFLRNRFAADTLEGLVRWRLLEQRVDHDVEATVRALDLLVGKGLLREVQSPASGPLFSLDAGHTAEAERFVEEE